MPLASESVAAPATVGGETCAIMPLGEVLGRRHRWLIREPGDLPSAVVTREQHRAGCPDVREICLFPVGKASISFAVTVKRPQEHNRARTQIFKLPL